MHHCRHICDTPYCHTRLLSEAPSCRDVRTRGRDQSHSADSPAQSRYRPTYRQQGYYYPYLTRLLEKNANLYFCVCTLGTTYLYLACEKQNLKLSRLLLESKASIQGHMPDGELRTHLLGYSMGEHTPVSLEFNFKSCLRSGRTLLLVACARGHLAAAKTLVDQKADVKAADNEGYGPIHLACLNRDLNMAKYFVESCKLDIEAISKQGKTALSLAREVKGEALVSYVEGVIVNGTGEISFVLYIAVLYNGVLVTIA
eukprot:1385587-Amorphochlora_amoeboformis.AAC.1